MTIFTIDPARSKIKDERMIYCFHIKFPNNQDLYLTESDKSMLIDDKIFVPNSGMTFKEGKFNDSGQNYIIIEGIFENKGVEKHYDLTDSIITIYRCSGKNLTNFVRYRCHLYIKRDLDFTLHLAANTISYNQTILLSYSKNCRANFGDQKCKVNKADYSEIYEIQEIFGKTFVIVNLDKKNFGKENRHPEDGYFNGGDIYIHHSNFHSKIISHTKNLLVVDKVIPDNIKQCKTAQITAGCDKNFITCCNKFNNAVNFRGEPFIPDDKFIKL